MQLECISRVLMRSDCNSFWRSAEHCIRKKGRGLRKLKSALFVSRDVFNEGVHHRMTWVLMFALSPAGFREPMSS